MSNPENKFETNKLDQLQPLLRKSIFCLSTKSTSTLAEAVSHMVNTSIVYTQIW